MLRRRRGRRRERGRGRRGGRRGKRIKQRGKGRRGRTRRRGRRWRQWEVVSSPDVDQVGTCSDGHTHSLVQKLKWSEEGQEMGEELTGERSRSASQTWRWVMVLITSSTSQDDYNLIHYTTDYVAMNADGSIVWGPSLNCNPEWKQYIFQLFHVCTLHPK